MTKYCNVLFERVWLPGLIIIIIAACQSQVEKPPVSTLNKFSDSLIKEIYTHQDKRDIRALLEYFDHDTATYRREAALALASVQDTMAIPRLAHLLNDSSPKVRRAAAYALGQCYDSSAVKPLAEALHHEDSTFVRKELLEALGKVITQPRISLLYNQRDESTEDKEGLAWGLYRAGLRNVHDGVSVKLAASLLDTTNSHSTRLGAAHFLSRTRNLDLTAYKSKVLKSATQDPSAFVRMASTSALRNTSSPETKKIVLNTISKDNDYRVRVNALHTLSSFNYNEIKTALFEALNDSNINVAITAADILSAQAMPIDAVVIIEKGLKHDSARVKASLLATALKLTDNKKPLIDQIKQQYEASDNPYHKAGLLTALGNSLQSYEFLVTQSFSQEHSTIGTASITALINLRTREDFPQELRPAFADVFRQAIESGDIAMVALVSGLLGTPEYGFKDEYDSINFLYEAKNKLSLPKDNEAIQVLNRTIAYFEGSEEMPETKNTYNHPIDWKLVESLPKDQEVLIKTVKGDITLRLLVEKAPGSVVNFVALAQDGYFNGKNFHRVVPNFVIQGGCNRGDGYGGEDYSIRSEFANLRYQEGSVGMASAGKDTEGTQWFITHSPTPHLDGRYTIFAQVTEGMDVVHQMEVGDKILSVDLIP